MMIEVLPSEKAMKKDVVETDENPFDIGTSFLGIDSRTSANANERKRQRGRQRELDSIKDDDLKRELKKGSTLLSYSEQLP
jgi:hypothetical protein